MILFQRNYLPYTLCGVVYLIFALINPDSGYDKYFDIWWTHEMILGGITSIYQVDSVNYPPLVLYIIGIFSKFFSHPDQVDLNTVNALKPIKMFFDLVILCSSIYLLQLFKKSSNRILFFLLNIAFWFGTLIWAQYDSMFISFLLLAFILAYRKRWNWAIVLFMMALNTKHISILALPILGLYYFHHQGFRLKPILQLLGYATVVQLLIFTPFIVTGHFSEAISAIFARTVSHHSQVSCNAQNIWMLICDGDPFEIDDKAPFWGKNYLFYGLLFFLSFSALALIPIAYQNIVKKYRFSFSRLLLTMGIVGIAFYYLNTEMHERYLHLPLIFVGLFTLLNLSITRAIVFVGYSLFYAISLEKVIHFFSYLPHPYFTSKTYLNSLIFDSQLLSLIFLGVLIYYCLEFIIDLSKRGEVNA